MSNIHSTSCAIIIACMMLAVAIPMSVPAAPRALGDPAILSLDVHNRTAIWNLTNLSGFNAANLSVSNGGAVLEIVNYDVGTEWLVSGETKEQRVPSTVVDSKDRIIVTWQDNRSGIDYDIYAKVYDSTGAQVGSEITVSNAAGNQTIPSLAIDSKDNFIVAWGDRRGANSDIYAKVFNSSTGAQVGSEVTVSNEVGNQTTPVIAADPKDNFIVAWEDTRGANMDLYAKVFNTSTGAQVGSEITVTNEVRSQLGPGIAVASNCNFMVSWTDFRSGGWYDLYAKIFNSLSGAQVGSEITVSDAPDTQSGPAIAINSKDNFVVTWTDLRSWSFTLDIYGKIYNSTTGAQVGSEITVTTDQTTDQMNSAIAVDSVDNLFVTWEDYRNSNYNISAKVVSAINGSTFCGEMVVTNDTGWQFGPAVTIDSTDTPLVVFSDNRSGSGYDIYAMRVHALHRPSGQLSTPDFSPTDLYGWTNLSTGQTLRNAIGNSITLEYSTDSGANWTLVPSGGSLADANASTGKIRFRATLMTNDVNSTPVLYNLTVKFIVNKRPTVATFPTDGAAPKNQPLTLAATASDTDSDAMTYNWYLVGPPASWVTLTNASSANATFKAMRSGTYTINLTVNDGYQNSTERTVNLTVTNHLPQIAGPSTMFTQKKEAVVLPFNGSDTDNDDLTFGWLVPALPGITLSDSDIAQPTFTATNVGNYTLQLRVDDGEVNVTAEVIVTVIGRQPVANMTANQTSIYEGDMISFDASASSDPDGDALEFRFDFGDGNISDWTDDTTVEHVYGTEGTYTASVQVRDSDGNGTISDQLNIEVLPLPAVNLPPMAGFISEYDTRDPFNMTFISTSYDPDGVIIETRWDFADGSGDIGDKVTHQFTVPGIYPVLLTVTDDSGAMNSTTNIVSIIAPKVNHAPVITETSPTADRSVKAGEPLSFSITVEDADKDVLTYTWSIDGDAIPGATGPSFNVRLDKEGIHTVMVEVTDGESTPLVTKWNVTVTEDKEPTSSDASSNLPNILVVIVVVIVAIVVVMALMMRKKGRPAAVPQQQPAQPQYQGQQPGGVPPQYPPAPPPAPPPQV